jgi:hypothetical protein
MAQIKIYSLRENLSGRRKAISDAIHSCVTSVLGLPHEKRFHRFIALEEEDFIYPSDRGRSYTIIEVGMFEGRTPETKKEFIRALFKKLEKAAAIPSQDVEITPFRTPYRRSWCRV